MYANGVGNAGLWPACGRDARAPGHAPTNNVSHTRPRKSRLPLFALVCMVARFSRLARRPFVCGRNGARRDVSVFLRSGAGAGAGATVNVEIEPPGSVRFGGPPAHGA